MNRLSPLQSCLLLGATLVLTACIPVTQPPVSPPSSPAFTVSPTIAPDTPIPATPLSAATITPASPPAIPDELLPHTFYYQTRGQVFRMERDGKAITQLTFEPVDVTGYDVSVVDGGPREENYSWITSPVFSPNSQTLAYGHNGLNLYDISTGVSNLVIENQLSDPHPDGMRLPIETYSPVRYSPDGTKLLVALGHWESPPSHAIYYPDTNALVRYAEVQDYINCCSYHGGPVWSPDSSGFYGVASIHDTCCLFGELWKVAARNGTLTRMLRPGAGMAYLPKEPYLAPDGQLYFFFGMYPVDSGYWEAPMLNLVRSAPDGVSDRTVLRDENFVLMTEALWAPDASFAIVSTLPARNWNLEGGVLELYYTDGQKSAVWLAPLGHDLKWGP